MDEELIKLFSTGKYEYGVKSAKKYLFRKSAKLIIFSSTVPFLISKEIKNLASINNIPIIELKLDGVELGKYLGRAHAINIITVTDLGTAKLERIKDENNGR